MATVKDIAKDFIDLYDEVDSSNELYQTVVGGIKPVSGVVLYFSRNGYDSFKSTHVSNVLYKEEEKDDGELVRSDANSLPDCFSDDRNCENNRKIELVLELGVAKSEYIDDTAPGRMFSRYRILDGFDYDSHQKLVDAAETAELARRMAPGWEELLGTEKDLNWDAMIESGRIEKEYHDIDTSTRT